jgi:hypothetical protein
MDDLMIKPFAYICHKDNHWAGITSPEVSNLKQFLGRFAADGFSIITVADREEYERVIGGMKMWRDHPDYQST